MHAKVNLRLQHPETSSAIELVFSDVLGVHIGPMGLQNVVLEAGVFDSARSSSAEYQRALQLAKPRGDLTKGDIKLFYIEPSWGAECVIAAKSLRGKRTEALSL